MSTALVFPIYDSSTTTKETNTFIESAVKRQGKILAVRRSSPRKRSSENALESPGGSSPKSPRQMSPRKNAKTTPSNKPKGCHSPLKTPPNTQRSKSVSGVKKSPLENQDSPPSARRSPKGHKTWIANFTIPNRVKGGQTQKMVNT
ncbi:uncharacterized protein LOC141884746 isoform X2 [Acropora palmata]|uniref:uncharacterized protein LOC141884746 isoform X2 n=1 Tax=Acropora palmata TaxID=6131 RepID=UPI003DA1802C